jgi:hypothetical protein
MPRSVSDVHVAIGGRDGGHDRSRDQNRNVRPAAVPSRDIDGAT